MKYRLIIFWGNNEGEEQGEYQLKKDAIKVAWEYCEKYGTEFDLIKL